MRRLALRAIVLLAVASSLASARTISTEERVAARRAVDDLYRAHQIGAGPLPSLDARTAIAAGTIDRSLRMTAALSIAFATAVGPDALERELERMARRSRMPDRLAEIYAVLGDDAALLRETVVRPVVVERLLRTAFAAGGAESPAAFDAWWAGSAASFDPASVSLEAGPSGSPPRPEASVDLPGDDSWENASLDDLPDVRQHASVVWTGTSMIVWGGQPVGAPPLDGGARYDPALDAWTPVTRSGAPAARERHTAVWTGSRMIVWGGRGATGYLAGGGSYDPTADAWTPIATSGAPSPRGGHTAVWTGSRMVVWGGTDDTQRFDTGGRYDPASNTWSSTRLTQAPSPRVEHTAVWTGSTMIVWGGVDFAGDPLGDGARYDPAADAWSGMASNGAPVARSGHAAVWCASRMVIWGGAGANGFENSGSRYDPATNKWFAMTTTAAPTARADVAAVSTGTRMVVWGGDDGGAGAQDGGRYDPAADAWSGLAIAGAPQGRRAPLSVWTGTRMIVWGGSRLDGVERLLDTGGRYDPTADAWLPTNAGSAPSARSDATSLWTGSWWIVWHGTTLAGPVLDGSRYDPALDVWSPMNTVGDPPREVSAAVWAGGRLVAWGGLDAVLGLVNTGSRYDPVADAWQPTSTIGAPPPLSVDARVAVSTGDRMIVWGRTGTFGTAGGRYDPVADTWSPMTSAGAPPAASYAAAAWSGCEMLVFGGELQGGAPIGNGSRYDPRHDRWTPMTFAGQPTSRTRHVAVWTGREWIVWGGLESFASTGLTDGARYEPFADQWTPTATAGAPSGRYDARAVWTGGRMVVWGGYSLSGTADPYRRDGYRYDPGSDAWSVVSTAGAPSSRTAPAAVWNGDRMLVWGGSNGGDLRSGGRYRVSLDSDLDGLADAADLCPFAPDPAQPDLDGDGVGDACDPDLDGDCAGNPSDCAPTDGSAFAAATEASGLTAAADRATWTWTALDAGSGTVYDLARGDLGELRIGSHAAEVCVAAGSATPSGVDPAVPAAGSGFWYLARGRNGCGSGSWGTTSGGAPRSVAACP